jgi:hypothetical protein
MATGELKMDPFQIRLHDIIELLNYCQCMYIAGIILLQIIIELRYESSSVGKHTTYIQLNTAINRTVSSRHANLTPFVSLIDVLEHSHL